jgi:hypothetical protein
MNDNEQFGAQCLKYAHGILNENKQWHSSATRFYHLWHARNPAALA